MVALLWSLSSEGELSSIHGGVAMKLSKRISEKGFFTTGQVASLCEVSSHTVVKWMDSGLLSGFRLPGSQDRRVSRAELQRFLLENRYDEVLARISGRKAKIVVIGQETKALLAMLYERYPAEEIETYRGVIEAAHAGCFEVLPRVFVFPDPAKSGDGLEAARVISGYFQAQSPSVSVRLVGIASDPASVQSWRELGVCVVPLGSADAQRLILFRHLQFACE